jgi:glycosyltransferase involved in cell wall biosynthesis
MKNILVLTSWSFADALVQNYTLPYVRIMQKYLPEGSKIYLMTLEQPHLALSQEAAKHTDEELARENIISLRYPYKRFGIGQIAVWSKVFAALVLLIFRKKIYAIHPWCTPAGAAGFILSLLTGKKLILDSYEPHAEAMLESKTWTRTSAAFRILFFLEKMQSRRAKIFIGCTSAMRHYAEEKYGVSFSGKKFYSKPACVNFELFDLSLRKNEKLLAELDLVEKVVCVYAGKFGGSYLEKEVFDFFAVCADFWGEKFSVLLLTSHSEEEIAANCLASGFDRRSLRRLFVPHTEVPRYMALADFGITPFKPVPSKRYGTPVKNGEYWALGLPVVITKNISDDSDIISQNDIGYVLQDLNEAEYKRAAQKIHELLLNREKTNLTEKIRATAEKYRSFGIAEKIYQEIYGN